MRTIILLLLGAICQSSWAQVDHFTGDFTHSVPVVTVPSSDGPSIPVSLNYSAGIRVLQEASWIGQGWNMNLGQISRDLKGIPDDWRGKTIQSKEYTKGGLTGSLWIENSSKRTTTHFYGPVYFKDFNDSNPLEPQTSSMDTYVSIGKPNGDKELSTFEYPDYDDFYVSAPNGKGGVMKAFLFEDKGGYLLHKKTPPTNETSNDGTSEFLVNGSDATDHSAQFVFKDEQSNLYAPELVTNITHQVLTSGSQQCIGGINQTGTYNGDFNADGSVKTGRQIKYFTNRQINEANGHLSGFIECPEMTGQRLRNDHTIGAFSVKMGNGFTYYYSLPVYRLNETNYHLEKDDNGQFNKVKATIKNNKYATSWKLTAITGPDYSDKGEQGFDKQDNGYWVVYRYAKYADNQPFQVPFKGGNTSFNEQPNYGTYKTLLNYEFKENEAITIGQTEVYYPEYIQTSSHTALFVKSLRQDGYGTDQSPQLKLDRVVLLRNEDVSQLTNHYSNTFQPINGLTTANVNMDHLLHDGVWTSRYNAVKEKVLGAIELTQDYSLMPGHYHNIANNYQAHTTEQVNGTDLTYEKGQVSGNEGVLTLKAIKTYGYQHESHIPEQRFTYGHNPRFDQDKEDIWGFYKSDYTQGVNQLYSQIPTATGQDAWSLSEIKSPTGGKMIIHYEADQYSQVRNERIQRAFEIEQVNMLPGTQKANLTLSNEFYDYICTQNNTNNLDTLLVRQPFFYQGTNCNAPSKGFGHKFYTPNTHLNWGSTGYINCQTSNTQLYLHAPYAHSGCSAVPVPPTIAPENGSIVLYLKSVVGGGLRVKAIETVNGDDTSYQTTYSYEGGVAGSEPERIVPANFNGILKNHVLYDRLNYNPAVGYSKVTIHKKGADNTNGPLRSELHFSNYNGLPSVGVSRDHKLVQSNGTNSQITCGNFSDFLNDVNFALIKDYKVYEVLTAIDLGRTAAGKLNKRITYDDHNNILSSVMNTYKTYNNLQESFRCNKKTRVEKFYNPYFYTADGIVDQYHIPMETYSVYNRYTGHTKLVKQVSYSNGTKQIVQFDYDKYSGIPVQSTTYNAETGQSTVVQSTPAYQLPQYADMGLSTEDPTKTNFLYQSGDQILTIDGQFHDGLYQTYKTAIPTRQRSGNGYITQTITKSRLPDKTYVSNGQSNRTNWKKAKETTLFNEKGDVLEAKNEVNRYAASKYGYNDQYLIAALSNARYEEFTFSGAEDLTTDFFGGEVAKGNGRLSTDAHSGNYALQLPSGRKGFIYKADLSQLDADRKYQARVWTKQSATNNARLKYTIQNTNGQTVTSGYTSYAQATLISGDWHQLQLDIPIPNGVNGTLTIACENASSKDILLDDFRFHPKDSPLTTYVYDPIRGFVTHVLNKDNMYSRMEYDVHGRLNKTFVETTSGEKLVTETTYNYKQ